MKKLLKQSCIVLVMLALSSAFAEEESIPAELKNLLEQYNAKLRADSKPVTEKLLVEMKKLEQKLINERRLSDALILQKKQKEISDIVAPSSNQPKLEDFVPARSKEDLKTSMNNSIWVLKHEGNGTILSVVVFHEHGSCLIASAIDAKWQVGDEYKVVISAGNLSQTGIINLTDKKKFTYQYGSGDIAICEFVGRCTPKKK